MKEWQAAALPEAIADIIDSAVEGTPQLIRRRDGKAVVVVSEEMFDKTAPDNAASNLRDYLLTAGYADEHDEFDDALRRVREGGGAYFDPRPVDLDD